MAQIIQIAETHLTVLASTALVDPAFVPLLTLPFECHGGDVLALFSTSFSASPVPSGLTNPEFRLTVDGSLEQSTSGCVFVSTTGSASLDWVVVAPAPGVRTFVIDWAKGPGGVAGSSAVIDPPGRPSQHHASLVLIEFAP